MNNKDEKVQSENNGLDANVIKSLSKPLFFTKEYKSSVINELVNLKNENLFLKDKINALQESLRVYETVFQQKMEELNHLEENVRNLNSKNIYFDSKAKELDTLGENVRNLNAKNIFFDSKAKELDTLGENVKRNNSDIEFTKFKLSQIERLAKDRATIKDQDKYFDNQSNQEIKSSDMNHYHSIDYFDFENNFRGSIETIKERQKIYLPYFLHKKNVLDLGCGRGEFLQLLKENGIEAKGVDLYQDYVDYCNAHGLNVVYHDAVAYLKETNQKIDGVFAGQLIEHMPLEAIIEMSQLVYDKMDEGCYFIVETPNPMSLAIFSHSFYLDPSHVKPVHPYTMRYILQRCGFNEIQILFTEESRCDCSIPKLESETIKNLDAFNEAMKAVSDQLFGSQDYAIIARK